MVGIVAYRRAIVLEIPYCCIRIDQGKRVEVCVDAYFTRFIERGYRVAFMMFDASDIHYLVKIPGDNAKTIKLSNTLGCENTVKVIVDAYMDAKNTVLSSSRKLYYTLLLRLLGPIVVSRFFRDLISSEEKDVVEAGKAASIIENFLGKQIFESTNTIHAVEKTTYLIISKSPHNDIEFIGGAPAVVKNYKYLYNVDRGFKKKINEITR